MYNSKQGPFMEIVTTVIEEGCLPATGIISQVTGGGSSSGPSKPK